MFATLMDSAQRGLSEPMLSELSEEPISVTLSLDEIIFLVAFTCWLLGMLTYCAVRSRKSLLAPTVDGNPLGQVSETDRAVHLATAAVTAVAGLMILLSFPVMGVSFFAHPDLTLGEFLKKDFFCIQNALHGGFLMGGWSNWISFGNPRYYTIVQTVLLFISFPSGLSLVLSLVQTGKFGLANTGSALLVSAGMLGSCIVAMLTARRAHLLTLQAAEVFAEAEGGDPPFTSLESCSEEERQRLQQDLSDEHQSLRNRGRRHERLTEPIREVRFQQLRRQRLVGLGDEEIRRIIFLRSKLSLRDPWSALEDWKLLKRRAMQWLYANAFCILMYFVSIWVFRLQSLFDEGSPFSERPVSFILDFAPSFVHSYSLSIHLGWILGNGVHSVQSQSRKTFQVFLWGKMFFVLLTSVQTLGFLAQILQDGVGTNQSVSATETANLSAFAFNALFPFSLLLIWSLVQFWSCFLCYEMYRQIGEMQFDEDRFVGVSGDAASMDVSTTSIWHFSQHPQISEETRYWAVRAAVGSVGTIVVFQVQAFLLVLISNSQPTEEVRVGPLESVVLAMNFSLHVFAIFMLTFYRSVQNFQDRLRLQKIIQSFIHLLYTLLSSMQALSVLIVLWWGPIVCRLTGNNNPTPAGEECRSPSMSETLVPILVLTLIRLVVSGVTSVAFAWMRLVTVDAGLGKEWVVAEERSALRQSRRLLKGSIPADQDSEQQQRDDMTPTMEMIEIEASEERKSLLGDQDGKARRRSRKASQHLEDVPGSGVAADETVTPLEDALESPAEVLAWEESFYPDHRQGRFRIPFLMVWGVYLGGVSLFALVLVVAESLQGSVMGLGGGLSPANLGAHSLAFGVVFHFCVIVFGYASRAVTSANLMYLRFTQLTNMSGSWLCLSAVLAWIFLLPSPGAEEHGEEGMGNGAESGSHGPVIRMSLFWGILLILVWMSLFGNAVSQWSLANWVYKNIDRFQQRGHAMV